MGIFDRKKRKGGFVDEIRCDESAYLIWKWHPAGSQLNENNRENAIRWGSSLRVKDGEVAVFVYKQKDGTMQDFIVGPYDEIIETENLPVLSKIVGFVYDGGTPFQAEVYFINLARILQVKFAVPFFDVYDSRFTEFGVPVAVRGTVNFGIADYREFIKIHRLSSFKIDDFQNQIRDAVSHYVKDVVANASVEYDISIVQIERKISKINDIVEYDISKRLKETFGVIVSSIDISTIEIDKSSEGYYQLMSVTKDITRATVEAESKAKIRDIYEKQRIEVEHYESSLRIQREEGQYAQHKATQTANFNAFQVEKQAEVGIAGAEAIGKMNTNGTSNIDLGCSGEFNPISMMTNIALGSVVSQNIASTMNNAINSVAQTQIYTTPLVTHKVCYNVVVDGKATGPFDIETLTQMAAMGQFLASSLVWKVGMNTWIRADCVEELKGLFMPPIPLQ